MTDQTRLDEIRARVEAATPGPWEGSDSGMLDAMDGDYIRENVGEIAAPEDATFIAHSRTDVPYLLDLVDLQVAELADLRAVVEEARGHLEWAPKSMTYKEFNDSVLVAKAILDRGLKGSGE